MPSTNHREAQTRRTTSRRLFRRLVVHLCVHIRGCVEATVLHFAGVFLCTLLNLFSLVQHVPSLLQFCSFTCISLSLFFLHFYKNGCMCMCVCFDLLWPLGRPWPKSFGCWCCARLPLPPPPPPARWIFIRWPVGQSESWSSGRTPERWRSMELHFCVGLQHRLSKYHIQ